MKLAILHPGSRMAYAIPAMLFQAGLVSSIYTDFFLFQDSPILKLVDKGFLPKKYSDRYLRSRTSSDIDSSYIKSLNLEGIKLFWQRSKSKNLLKRLRLEYLMAERLCQLMLLDEAEFTGVYSFISASHELFSLFDSKIKILDVMHPPHQFLIPHLRKESLRFPEWQEYKDPYTYGAEKLLIEREYNELINASLILAPSQFVMDTLTSVVPEKSDNVVYSPYPLPLWVRSYDNSSIFREQKSLRKTLRILFVGSVNLRKGIQYLLPALRQLQNLDIQLHVVGKIDINTKKISEYDDICDFKGFMSKAALSDEYKWADIFVFPSIAEGSASVIYEAMSFGLPIITTYATGSIVRNNIEGFVIQQPSVEELIDKISALYFNRELLKVMSDNVVKRISLFETQNLSPIFATLLETSLL